MSPGTSRVSLNSSTCARNRLSNWRRARTGKCLTAVSGSSPKRSQCAAMRPSTSVSSVDFLKPSALSSIGGARLMIRTRRPQAGSPRERQTYMILRGRISSRFSAAVIGAAEGCGCAWIPALIVPIHALAALVALLRLDRQRGDGAGFQAAQRNGLAHLFAIAVGAVLDAGERGVDLGDQLALAVACAQLDRPVGFRGSAVGEIGMVLVLVLQMLEGFARLLEDFLPPREQALADVVPLALVHEWLFVRWPVVILFSSRHAPRLH